MRNATLSVRLALATGLTVTAIALGLVLSQTPLVLAGTNGVSAGFAVSALSHGGTFCQRGGTLPAGTVAIRVSLSANAGPRVSLQALSGSRVVATGERGAGWGIDETVTVPVARVATTVRDTRVCATVGQPAEPIQVNGTQVRTAAGGEAVWLRLEYLRHGTASWASLAASVAHRMGLAHAPAGTWLVFPLLAAMLAVCVLASRLLISDLP
ncbi:MAG TPA: hypothetical protein VGX72_09425 [Solirubrobacteraceae bacterium]|nr:hypothetical protein [Solirubrobacteraceae bacterium]